VTADVEQSLSGRLYAEAKDQKSGDQLRAVINGALAAAKMMAGDDQNAGAILNGLQATGAGQSVEVDFTLPPSILDNLQKFSPSGSPTAPKLPSDRPPASAIH
jgi:hypothetical protein